MRDEIGTDTQSIADFVLDFYLGSRDFNGTPLHRVLEADGGVGHTLDIIRGLVRDGVLEIVSSEWEINPHIKRFRPPSVDRQLAGLESDGQTICLYPSPGYLRQKVDLHSDLDRPFTRRLRLGDAQLEPVFFDLSVLERYHAEPRYHFDFQDVEGWVGVKNAHYESEEMALRDKVFLQTFGIGRNAQGRRVVVVFLRYLHNLTPEHQRHWEGHLDPGTCKLDPDYFRMSILGEWPEAASIYEAFLEELYHINQMIQRTGRPPLFRQAFRDDRPRDFGLILRPTRRNYYNFVHLLDKMISDNLNRDFFQASGLHLDEEIARKGGRIEVRPKGTLRLLSEWLQGAVRVANPAVLDDIVQPLREVRELRTKNPAHAVQHDEYDPSYHTLQDELIERVYGAVRLIRLLLANHPALKDYSVPEWLYEGRIRIY